MLERPPACQIGPSRCHGCASWCDDCGDVADVCDAYPNCDAHRCTTCGCKALTRDYECESCLERASYVWGHGTPEERLELQVVYAIESGNRERAERLRAEIAALRQTDRESLSEAV